nr:MAG TPA: hypothetical protein [Caudoviricetes sp.]
MLKFSLEKKKRQLNRKKTIKLLTILRLLTIKRLH